MIICGLDFAVQRTDQPLPGRGREDSRRFGKPLRGDTFGFWRWRAGDCRIIGRTDGDQVVVIVVRIAHRSIVYAE